MDLLRYSPEQEELPVELKSASLSSKHLEVEAKLISPMRNNRIGGIDLSSLPHFRLEQHYLSKGAGKAIDAIFARHGVEVPPEEVHSTLRVRKSESLSQHNKVEGVEYFLTVKGPKNGERVKFRAEYELPISQKEYETLRDNFSRGVVEKERFLFYPEEAKGIAKADIDVLKAVGSVDKGTYRQITPSFATIDIEFTASKLSQAASEVPEVFDTLLEEALFVADNKRIESVLGNKRLAKEGLSKKEEKSLYQFLARNKLKEA